MRVVLATANPGKVAELSRILDGLPIELVTAGELGVELPEETGSTYEANALLKAEAVARATGMVAVADDSGLEVDALGGAPGVSSAHYAGPDADDEANNRRLLAELAGVPPERRTARFVCVAAVVTPDGRRWTVRGELAGRLTDRPRGSGGFGYDPLFIAEGQDRTNAELPPHAKDAISHRGRAFRQVRAILASLLTGGDAGPVADPTRTS